LVVFFQTTFVQAQIFFRHVEAIGSKRIHHVVCKQINFGIVSEIQDFLVQQAQVTGTGFHIEWIGLFNNALMQIDKCMANGGIIGGIK